jgi:hypothetical protein
VTEDEWMASADPRAMLTFLRAGGHASDRKYRLFSVACCRALWPLLADKPYRHAVDVAEQYCDRLAGPSDRAAAEESAGRVAWWGGGAGPLWEAAWYTDPAGGALANSADPDAPAVLAMAAAMADAGAGAELCVCWATALGARPAGQAALLRDVMHAPFRPVLFKSAWRVWNCQTVSKMARSIYDQRAFDQLPILADALEDAGCTEPAVLGHCRSGGEHVRGCWVVDLLLGKG